MSAANLWPRPMNSMGGGSSTPLVQFRAGRCKKEGTRVTPDPRKGLFQIVQDPDELKHVIWKDRTTGASEDIGYVLGGDAEFLQVPQSSGRVFLMRWPQDKSKDMFLWMQEPNADRDTTLFDRVNRIINGSQSLDVSEDRSVAVPAPATTPVPSSAVAPAMYMSQTSAAPSVAELLRPEVVLPVLQDPAISESLQSLVEHLPEGDSSPDAIAELLRSPQFHQQVNSLTQALRSGQAGELLASFGIFSGSGEDGMHALLQGLLRYHAESRNRNSDEDHMDES